MDNLNTVIQNPGSKLAFRVWLGIEYCSLHPKGRFISQMPAFAFLIRGSQQELLNIYNYKVAIISEIFFNLNIPLVNACVMKCFAINLLNKTALIILHVAVKQAREIVPIRKLEESLIQDSWVSTLILFSRMSYCFFEKGQQTFKVPYTEQSHLMRA